jgi:hypothetical protein
MKEVIVSNEQKYADFTELEDSYQDKEETMSEFLKVIIVDSTDSKTQLFFNVKKKV